MAMTPLPAAPQRDQDPATFATTADTFVAALPGFVTEANLLESNVDMLANEAMIDAATATTQAGIATTQASNALASANAADVSEANALASANAAALSESNAASYAASAVANSALQKYKFDTAILMSDPSTGYIRFDNAAMSSVTAIAVDAQTNDVGNPNVLDWLLTFDDSTSAIKGQIIFSEAGSPSNFAIFNVTSLVNNTGWVQLNVAHVTSSGSFALNDIVVMDFKRAGDAGVPFPTATQLEMEQGTETALRSMSPKLVLDAIAANSTGTGGQQTTGDTVLTAASPAMNSVTTTAYGQSVTLPDATTVNEGIPIFGVNNSGGFQLAIKNAGGTILGYIQPNTSSICSLVDNTTIDGVWKLHGAGSLGVDVFKTISVASSIATSAGNIYLRRVTIDATRELFLLSGDTSVHAVVYDYSTDTMGSPVLYRTANIQNNLQATLQSSNQVLVVSCPTSSTALEARILSVSGTTITLNAVASVTLAGNIASMGDAISNGFVQVGSAFLFSYTRSTTTAGIRAITVSGTTVTIGAEAAPTGVSIVPVLYPITSSTVLSFSYQASTLLYINVFTVSGTTLTLDGTDSLSSTINSFSVFETSGRWMVVYVRNSTTTSGAVISVSGTTPSNSTVDLFTNTGSNSVLPTACHQVGNQVIVAGVNNGDSTLNINVLTNTAGVASVGTVISSATGTASSAYAGSTTNELWITYQLSGATHSRFASMGISGANPVITNEFSYGNSLVKSSASTVYKSPTGATSPLLFNSTMAMMPTTTSAAIIAAEYNGKSVVPSMLWMDGGAAVTFSRETSNIIWYGSSSSSSNIRSVSLFKMRLV